MNPLWAYFWPLFAAGLVIGADRRRRSASAAGKREAWRIAVRRRRWRIGAAALWHGPLGAADRFADAGRARCARQSLDYYEMTPVTAQLHRGPLTRRLILSGPADDFQRSELVRTDGSCPASASARWSQRAGGTPADRRRRSWPRCWASFSGLLLAYLIELRRRYNAQWNW